MTFVALCTSKGTVFQSVIDAMRDGSLTMTCAGLVSDSDDHECVQKANDAGIPVRIVLMQKGERREDFDRRVDAAIREFATLSPLTTSPSEKDELLVACMGWMWMFSPWFVKTWNNRILNVHPSLLPKHPGTHAHADVLKANEAESGMTIHLVDKGMDTGKILLQKSCSVRLDDTVETLKARVQALECEWYPKVLQMIEKKSLEMPR